MTGDRARKAVAVAIVAALVAGSALLLAGPAEAHNYRISSTPEPGETLTALPAKFEITTNGVLLEIGDDLSDFGMQVTDSSGRFYGDGCITVDGPSVLTNAALGAAGKYTMTWQVVSTDGHTVSDDYTFTWQPPAGFVPSAGSKKVPDCGGTLSVSQPAKGGTSTTASTVDPAVLSTVLWIGGAFLAVAVAVILTLVLTSRRRKPAAR